MGVFPFLDASPSEEQSTEGRAWATEETQSSRLPSGFAHLGHGSPAAAVAARTSAQSLVSLSGQNAVYMADWHLSSKLPNALQIIASLFPPSNAPEFLPLLSMPEEACYIYLLASDVRLILVCFS